MSDLLGDEMIRFAATPLSPFALRYLPMLGRLYRTPHARPPYGRRKRAVRLLARGAWRLLHAAGLGGTGIVRLRLPDGERDLRFDVRNTQFHALYTAEHLPCYEPETTALIALLLDPHDVFLDIGANWGWYSVVEASQPGFVGVIHAFEPNPQSFTDLADIVAQAGLGDRVHCHDVALADHDGAAAMSIPDGRHSGRATLDGDGDVAVKVARLDSFHLPGPGVIKLDVEDHEYAVLLGGQQTIARGRPFVIFENWSYPHRPELTAAPLRLLEEWRYQLYYIGWLAEDGSPFAEIGWCGGRAGFALVPFAPVYRGLLPPRANILAAPRERHGELRAKLQ
jgi:FkbM family methyltransferase